MGNQTTYLIEKKSEVIPFVDILLPYTKCFLMELGKINTSSVLVDKLHKTLLQEMSSAAELTLQEELDDFKDKGLDNYQEFVEITSLLLAGKYPVLDKILRTIVNNYSLHIQKIFSRFSSDFNLIVKSFSIEANENNVIKDIDTSLGDGHSGESTALVILSDGTKLIYKPRNIGTAYAYNLFIDWVNSKLEANLKTIKCIDCESYGWLEFVAYEAVRSPDELKEYYYQAGILLAITLLLGSKDCHYENIIASAKGPVIIDHETVVQPVLTKLSIRTWDEQHKIPYFSVLESMLIVNQNTGITLEHSGYGVRGNTEAMGIEKKVINANTIGSKRSTRFIFTKLVKENVPVFEDTYVFANNYKDSFIEGFSVAYDMFIASSDELLSSDSPILFFEHQEVRYVWRPTFVYFRILRYLRGATFMSSFETYQSKLYELISKAYKKDRAGKYKGILEQEVEQLLSGNIPLFTLSSLDCQLREDTSFRVFKSNSIENIRNRIASLSTPHKTEQIEYITKWLQICKLV